MFSTTDTIVAIATPRGRGALGIVRLSGPDALRIGREMTGRPDAFVPRRATFVRLAAAAGGTPDQVVATWFPAPHSSTGDDCLELTAHGSPVVLEGIVGAAVARGARRAGPGEFTFRAYVNGRIDLTQAEAVADLTAAVTPRQARAAFEQLEGRLGAAVRALSDRLLDLVAEVEASLDFPEEGYHFGSPEDIRARVASARAEIARLLSDAPHGCLLREGATVVISGRPNTGKSSLFNALLRTERAIVSPVAGTTRDVIIESFDLNGVPVSLVDTAGRRDASDVVEAEGVRRAETAVAAADLELLVLDGSEPLTPDDRALLSRRSPRRLVVLNKADLPVAVSDSQVSGCERVRVSALNGIGIGELVDRVSAALGAQLPPSDVPIVTNQRHVEGLRTADEALARAEQLAADRSHEELVAAELAMACRALDEVTGASGDVLARIFSRFCIGK